MAQDSDDDNLPLITRVTAQGTAGPSSAAQRQASLGDDDDLPAWAKTFKSPYKGGYRPPVPQDSDDDVLDLTKPSPPVLGNKKESSPVKEEERPSAAAPSSARKPNAANGSAMTTTHQPSQAEVKAPDSASKRASQSRGRPAAGRGKAQASHGTDTKPAPAAMAANPAIEAAAGTAGDAGRGAAGHTNDITDTDIEPVTLTQTQDQGASQGPGGRPPIASQKGRGSQAALPAGARIPIILPERVARNKALVELSAAGSHEEVMDLAGDAGAVGRVVVAGKSGEEELSLDLKGVVFRAVVLPLQGTAMVLNLQPAEARVESLVSDFIRLEDQGPGGWSLDDDLGGGGLAALLGDDDDDDNYAAGGGGGGEEEAEKGKNKAGSGSKAQKGGVSKGKKSSAAGAGKGKALGTKGGGLKKKTAARSTGKATKATGTKKK